MASAGTVAKKKGQSRAGRKPKPGGAREALIALKCHQDYKDWVAEYAEFKRLTPTSLIDHALAKMAELDGFKTPPPR